MGAPARGAARFFYLNPRGLFGLILGIIPTSARTDSCIFRAGGKGDRAALLMRRLADERLRVSVHGLTGISSNHARTLKPIYSDNARGRYRRRSFHTAWTLSGHSVEYAVQGMESPDLIAHSKGPSDLSLKSHNDTDLNLDPAITKRGHCSAGGSAACPSVQPRRCRPVINRAPKP